MECKKCKGTWNSQNNTILKLCPFCGVDLTAKESVEFDDSPEGIIKKIVSEHGIDIYNNPKIFKPLLKDYLTNDKKTQKLLYIILDNGGSEKLFKAKDLDEGDFAVECTKLAMQIEEDNFMHKEAGESGIAILCKGLDKTFTPSIPVAKNTAQPIAPNKEKEALTYYEKGNELFKARDFEEAIVCYDKAIALDDENADYYYEKGFTLFSLKRYRRAVRCFDKAIDLDDENAEYYFNKGYVLLFLDEYEEALECFDEAITLDDENAVYYSYKGYALLALGEAEEALECFEEAIELDPEYKMAHEGRNRCLEEM